MRKAQMEAFGLAIIVILVALGILFTLQFTVLSPKQQVRQPFVESQLASNLLGAILITSVSQDCPAAKDFTDLFTDYTRCDNVPMTCSYQGADVASYIYFDNVLKTIFDKTLNVSNKNYKFEIKVPDSRYSDCSDPSGGTYPPKVTIQQGFEDCLQTGASVTPARFFLPLGSGYPTVPVELAICS